MDIDAHRSSLTLIATNVFCKGAGNSSRQEIQLTLLQMYTYMSKTFFGRVVAEKVLDSMLLRNSELNGYIRN